MAREAAVDRRVRYPRRWHRCPTWARPARVFPGRRWARGAGAACAGACAGAATGGGPGLGAAFLGAGMPLPAPGPAALPPDVTMGR